MSNFTGTLNANEVFGAIFNMIISQQVFADNIEGADSSLVDHFRVDGGLFGDTKLYYSTDVLRSYPFGQGKAQGDNLGEEVYMGNLLKPYRPKDPKCQKIVLNVFRQIPLTVDNYLSKRAWSDEYSFAQFNSVMLGWLQDTKRVYDISTFNAFFGTDVSSLPTQNIEIDFSGVTGSDEEKNRLQAQMIGERLANLEDDLKDFTRDYNDYQNLRAFSKDKILIVFNKTFINKIRHVDLPTIYHNDDVIKFGKYSINNRFFGTVNKSGGTTLAQNKTIRSLIEKDYTGDGGVKHCFGGDLLPNNAKYKENETYTTDDTIICKVVYTDSDPYMSAFEVGTSFFNASSLTENHYLTFGHNTLEHLQDRPCITIKAKFAK